MGTKEGREFQVKAQYVQSHEDVKEHVMREEHALVQSNWYIQRKVREKNEAGEVT